MDKASIWSARVAEWRASGQTAPEYCAANGLSVHRLRYWAYKRSGSSTTTAKSTGDSGPGPTFARVVPTRPGSVENPSPGGIVLEVGEARVRVGRGFDRETLAELVELLGRGGSR